MADPFYKKKWTGLPPLMKVIKIALKNIYVNYSQNLAFATSHFVIELLPLII